MRQLILIKHSRPQIDPSRPAHEWELGEEGRRLCAPLAQKLAGKEIGVVVSSKEPKAVQTGELVADALSLPAEQADGLHEHDRSNIPHMATRDFQAAIAQFFAEPMQLVLGKETAQQAQDRIDAAVQKVVLDYPDKTIAVVTHGTVLSLFLQRCCGIKPYLTWKQFGLPSFVALSLPEMKIVETVERV